MIILKSAWDEVTEKTILNCFRKSGISVEGQTSAINDYDDPFEEIMHDREGDSAVEELEFGLNHFRKARLDLTPKNLDHD